VLIARLLRVWQPGFFASADLMKIKLPLLLAAAVAVLGPVAAYAAPPAPVQMTGTVLANVITPGSVTPLRGLRFGQFLRPTAAGTIVVTPTSVVTATGGTVGNISIPQLAPGRGSGAFTLTGGASRSFLVTLPTSATLTSGASSMTVTNFSANIGFGGFGTLNSSGNFILNVGGRLNVGGGQAVGAYAGTYNVTVLFL
jgi:Domain of unknown function (DUF4402)